jgi:hypothetical protein
MSNRPFQPSVVVLYLSDLARKFDEELRPGNSGGVIASFLEPPRPAHSGYVGYIGLCH